MPHTLLILEELDPAPPPPPSLPRITKNRIVTWERGYKEGKGLNKERRGLNKEGKGLNEERKGLNKEGKG